MQFHSHNNHTDKLEREAHQRLVSAPRYTYTTALLTQGKTCGMPHNLHTLAINGKAAQYRFACFTSKLFGRYHDILRDILHFRVGDELGTEYHLTPLCSDWWTRSIMQQLIKTVVEVHSIVPEIEHKVPDQHIQKQITTILLAHSPQERPEALIRRRLCNRFLSAGACAETQPMRTLATVSLIKLPFLTATLLKTWLNGWCTSRRFQFDTLGCFFGCGCQRGDQLEHYVCCPLLWRFLNRHAPRLYQPHHQHHDTDNHNDASTIMFLALHAPPDLHHTTVVALLLHTIFVTYETIRARGHDISVNDYTDKTNLLDTTLHFTISKHPELHDHLRLWNDNYHPPQPPDSTTRTRRPPLHARVRP